MNRPRGVRPCMRKLSHGFSLVELSIVLIVIGILASSAVAPLSTTLQQARYKQNREQLRSIKEAMHGYLISTGRLPCPVSITEGDFASDSKKPICSTGHGGLPAAELGIMGAQSSTGAMLDAWGQPYAYAVSLADHDTLGDNGIADWLNAGEPAAVGVSNLTADLQLCRQPASSRCAARDLVASQIVWVVLSLGQINSGKGLEQENRDNDLIFSPGVFSSHPENPFDDQMIWAARSEAVYWLLKTNWLP